ncbi:MAG: DUF5995 family protein [Anaerolineae bacterium]|nr:DUF5995 family protein [Anaerolineae bacterium]
MNSQVSVVDRMQIQIDLWDAVLDRRSIFLTCYAMMTRNMLVAAEAGEFRDGLWVSALLHHFADYYFDALERHDRQQADTPAVWRLTFEASGNPRLHVLQHLFLGVNAHICYDLVFALRDMIGPEWAHLSPVQRQARYEDHCHVNEIIYQTINRVQDQVIERYSPAMDLVDKLFFSLDEWMIYRMIANWREQVWRDAAQLVACSTDSESGPVCQRVEAHVLNYASAILGERGLPGLLDILT